MAFAGMCPVPRELEQLVCPGAWLAEHRKKAMSSHLMPLPCSHVRKSFPKSSGISDTLFIPTPFFLLSHSLSPPYIHLPVLMAGLPEGAKRTSGFWGAVGSVMVALKLKDKWDDCTCIAIMTGVFFFFWLTLC